MSTSCLQRAFRRLYSHASIGLVLALLSAHSAVAQAPSIGDDFEGTSIDPVWTVIEEGGTATLSTEQKVVGSKSVKFQAGPVSGRHRMRLERSFSSLLKGSVSVWFYDSAPNVNTLYLLLFLQNSRTGGTAAIGTQDYDPSCYAVGLTPTGTSATLGPSKDCVPGAPHHNGRTEVSRTLGWHHFRIDFGPNSTSFYIDSLQVYTTAGDYSFDEVQIYLSGFNSPNTFAYVDLFSIASLPPAITTSSPLPAGRVGTPYALSLTAANGTPPYKNWTRLSGGLPDGLVLSPQGVLSGTPTATGTFNFTVQAADNANVLTSKTFQITIDAAATGCNATLSSSQMSFSSNGATGSVLLNTGPACAWTAVDDAPWIGVTSGGAGAGPSTINFALQANTSALARTGEITIAGRTLTISQSGQSCSYTISPGSTNSPVGGGSGLFRVAATQGCNWTALSDAPWIEITSGATGANNGDVTFVSKPNFGTSPRAGTITVAGKTFTVSQLGQGQSYSCNASVGVQPPLRANGLTELTGDVALSCSGTVPAEGIIADVVLTLNSNITSRLISGDATEATLLLNNPTTPVLGTNAFRGRLQGANALRWVGIPLATLVAPATSLRLTNLRVNASQVPPSESALTPITAVIQVKSVTPVTVNNSKLDVATVKQPAALTVAPVTSGPNAGTSTITATFSEAFPTAFTRVDGLAPGPAESGYTHTALGSMTGTATNGTRLRIRFGNVPAGVNIYAPLIPQRTEGEGAEGAVLISDTGNQLPGVSVFGGMYHQLAVSNGVAVATWQVRAPTAEIDSYVFGLILENATASQAQQLQQLATASFAPASTVVTSDASAPIPRFRDDTANVELTNLRITAGETLVDSGTISTAKAAQKVRPPVQVVGSNARFVYTVTIDSSQQASGVIVRGNAPPGYAYTSCSRSDGGVCELRNNNTEAEATYGTLAGNASRTITMDAGAVKELPAGTYVENTVTVASREVDFDLDSNSVASGFVRENCPGPLTPATRTVSNGGGAGTVTMESCFFWSARSTVDWITIDSEKSGTGPAHIEYTVYPNPGQSQRTGNIIVGGLTHSVVQRVLSPGSIAVTGGTQQSAAILTQFVSPLVATVRDSANSPVSGVMVTFTTPGSGASGSFAGGVNTAVTNAQGLATSAAFTANGISGSYNVTASVSGVASSASFSLTNTPVVPPSCVTSISQAADTVSPAGKSASFAIVTTTGCAWTASSSQSWLEIFPIAGSNSGAITWTAYANFGTKVRTATVTVGSKTFTVTQTASTETVMQRFVRLLYFSYLGRAATDGEIAGQVNSGSSRSQLATNFMNSAEFNLGGRFTAGLYLGIINRDAEFTGWQFQRQALARGTVNQDQLVSNFLNSAEFSLKFGVLTNPDFVRLMYKNILLREPALHEVDNWVGVLSNPANTRTIVARSFLNSPEFAKGTGPRLLAFLLYATLLLRDGNAAERGPIEAQLADPDQLPALIASFANGAEIDSLLQ